MRRSVWMSALDVRPADPSSGASHPDRRVRKAGALLAGATSLAAALAANGCGSGSDAGSEVVRTDSAGVELVVSPAEDRPLAWSFEEDVRLGGRDSGPETFASVNFDRVGTDAEGGLYVLEGQAHRVVVFAPDGSHLRTMGSEGEGPGELRFPVSFAVRADGTAAVFDIGKRSMVPFGPDGEILAQDPFTFYTEPGTRRHFALTPEGYAVARGMAGADEDLRKIELRAWAEPNLFRTSAGGAAAADPEADDAGPAAGTPAAPRDTAILTELQLPRPDMADFGCMRLALQPLFTPVIQWDTEGSTIVAVDGARYVVDVYELDGTFVRSIRRDLPLRSATEADAVAEAGDGMRMVSSAGECEATAEEVVEARGFAPELPAIRNVLLAPSGEIWVQRLVPGVGSDAAVEPIDVFDPAGVYMGTLPEGTPFPLLILHDGRVVTGERDALDVERLVVSRVIRSGPGT